jgi:hypothetical protein
MIDSSVGLSQLLAPTQRGYLALQTAARSGNAAAASAVLEVILDRLQRAGIPASAAKV